MNLVCSAIVCLTLILLSSLRPESQQQQESAHHYQNDQVASTTPPSSGYPPTSAVRISEEQNQGDSQSVRVLSMPARDWIDYTVLGINVILAVIAGAGVLAAFGTLRVIRRQTKATEESVEETRRAVLATEKSVEAQMRTTRSFINVERPFIVVEAKGNVDHLSLVAINKGRTPARILFINPMLQWDYVPYEESLPPEPNTPETAFRLKISKISIWNGYCRTACISTAALDRESWSKPTQILLLQ